MTRCNLYRQDWDLGVAMFGTTVLGTQGLLETRVCVMGFQHDLVNFVLVFIHLTQRVRARNGTNLEI